ncbi:hypothetical protein [Sorangium sp. So ce854]|uniref:hypothetical protein n=1 Tax=Sorangium sp. So ce854 TaxID=3133322 RepID=UPI003F635167
MKTLSNLMSSAFAIMCGSFVIGCIANTEDEEQTQRQEEKAENVMNSIEPTSEAAQALVCSTSWSNWQKVGEYCTRDDWCWMHGSQEKHVDERRARVCYSGGAPVIQTEYRTIESCGCP